MALASYYILLGVVAETNTAKVPYMPAIDPLNLQLAAGLRGDFAEGWRIAQELERERPQDPRAAFNRGWYYMWRGDLQEGMRLMDLGRSISVFGSEMLPPEAPPQWPGSKAKLTTGERPPRDLEGKTVLLRGEGGFGDEMIHVRFAKDLAERGATVVVSCHAGLVSLFARAPGVARAVPHHLINQTAFDYWVPAMSAARWLGHTFDTLPGQKYLTADPAFVQKWAPVFAGPGKKVGIRWSGNPRFEHEQHRRFPAEPLIGLHQVPGVTVYSLQKGDDLRDLPPQVVDLGQRLESWEDTAAAMEHMDLVITSCTATAHLAGALGKPTWVIVPVLPYYLWALPGNTSPWYDTVRLFRQDAYGDWSGTLLRVEEEFKKWAGSVSSGDAPLAQAPASPESTARWATAPGVTPQESKHPAGQAQTEPARPAPGFGAPVATPAPTVIPTVLTPVTPAPVPPAPKTPAPLYVPGMYFAPKPLAKPLDSTRGKPPQGASTLHFVAGLPRAGSTVLINLLAQNPRIFGAPISGLCSIFSGVFANWDKGDFHKEMPNAPAKRRVLRAILDNYHDSGRPVTVDKDRMWVVHAARLEDILERPIKMIIPVRPLPEILTSFEVLRRRDPLELTGADDSIGPGSTIEARAQYFAGSGGPLGQAYNAMKDAVTQGYLDRMLFVDYNKLMQAPKMQLRRIYDFLEEPYFEHDLQKIEQVAHGDGRIHGYAGLHDVRPELARTSKNPREVLGPDVYAQFDQPEPWSQWT